MTSTVVSSGVHKYGWLYSISSKYPVAMFWFEFDKNNPGYFIVLTPFPRYKRKSIIVLDKIEFYTDEYLIERLIEFVKNILDSTSDDERFLELNIAHNQVNLNLQKLLSKNNQEIIHKLYATVSSEKKYAEKICSEKKCAEKKCAEKKCAEKKLAEKCAEKLAKKKRAEKLAEKKRAEKLAEKKLERPTIPETLDIQSNPTRSENIDLNIEEELSILLK